MLGSHVLVKSNPGQLRSSRVARLFLVFYVLSGIVGFALSLFHLFSVTVQHLKYHIPCLQVSLAFRIVVTLPSPSGSYVTSLLQTLATRRYI